MSEVEKDFCLECGVEIVAGGCWGYCYPCVEKLPNEEQEQARCVLAEGRFNALVHWEKCFLDGTLDDEHAEFIAGVLAKAREKLREDMV
jgi:hypothetical protein